MQDASSDSGGEHIIGMSELWVWGCNRPSSSFLPDTVFRLPSVETQEYGAKEAIEIEEKLNCCHLAPNSPISHSFPERCINGSWFFLNWRANLCYHLWIQDWSTILRCSLLFLCWWVTHLIVKQPFPHWNMFGHLQNQPSPSSFQLLYNWHVTLY